MKPSRELRDLVLGLLHDFSISDPALTEKISTSDGTVWIGTDPAEFFVGGPRVRAIFRRQRQEAPVRFKIDTGTIFAFEEGTVGWASVEATSTFDDGTSVGWRASLVFHREDGDWRAVQIHASLGRSNPEALGLELTTAIEEVAGLVEKERPNLTPLASPDGTVTILFTDLEASTALNEELGDDTFLPLLLKHNEIIRSHTMEAGGTVVKSQGDGFMIAFPSARRGVQCAIAVQQEVSALDPRLRVRMGIHTGEPVRQADDFYGRDVAYAARIGSVASGGEILVSALVRSLVEPSGSVLFKDPRELDLKGFDGPQSVVAVSW